MMNLKESKLGYPDNGQFCTTLRSVGCVIQQ